MRKRKSKKSRHYNQSSMQRKMNDWEQPSPIMNQRKLRFNKLTGKNHRNIDQNNNEDDYSDDDDNINNYDGEQHDDMIETSETIHNSHQNHHHNSLITSNLHNHNNEKQKKKSTKPRKPLGVAGATLTFGTSKASLSTIPKTSFECGDKRSDGVYADEETGCQVWHICQNGQMHSFLCPIGTVFNSKNGVCDWWYNVAC
ncbi:Chitin binding Peritrophin-A domain containing protein [Euroglyphus maynei]|uniref:Chitin binding Peritrophin-A domain containing protein n=1 Tax=Euroglyphus maynei TaxID=6958 RepID=A0A1Y3BJJ3_EURMA|nr:Chitin binding Peritrophin-A domain containing protein [Euroglyphus maynei]